MESKERNLLVPEWNFMLLTEWKFMTLAQKIFAQAVVMPEIEAVLKRYSGTLIELGKEREEK